MRWPCKHSQEESRILSTVSNHHIREPGFNETPSKKRKRKAKIWLKHFKGSIFLRFAHEVESWP